MVELTVLRKLNDLEMVLPQAITADYVKVNSATVIGKRKNIPNGTVKVKGNGSWETHIIEGGHYTLSALLIH